MHNVDLRACIHMHTQVIEFSVADCSSRTNCTDCLENGNPLCGWCVVENKCSKQSECQNSLNSGRWIQATGTDQCPNIMVSPEQYVVDNPQIVMYKSCVYLMPLLTQFSDLQITLTLSHNLPMPLENESYLCHFAANELTLMVEAVGSETIYTCNITDSIPSEFEGLSTGQYDNLIVPFNTRVN